MTLQKKLPPTGALAQSGREVETSASARYRQRFGLDVKY